MERNDIVRLNEWRRNNPEKVKANVKRQNLRLNPEINRKGGKYYEKHLKSHKTGLQGEKEIIRRIGRAHWGKYKKIIAPQSEIHHEWIPNTANYNGIALVEAQQHRYGIIDPIVILEGSISIFSEARLK